jgi:hypothetical protein
MANLSLGEILPHRQAILEVKTRIVINAEHALRGFSFNKLNNANKPKNLNAYNFE